PPHAGTGDDRRTRARSLAPTAVADRRGPGRRRSPPTCAAAEPRVSPRPRPPAYSPNGRGRETRALGVAGEGSGRSPLRRRMGIGARPAVTRDQARPHLGRSAGPRPPPELAVCRPSDGAREAAHPRGDSLSPCDARTSSTSPPRPAEASGETDLVVVGSQAILGSTSIPSTVP